MLPEARDCLSDTRTYMVPEECAGEARIVTVAPEWRLR